MTSALRNANEQLPRGYGLNIMGIATTKAGSSMIYMYYHGVVKPQEMLSIEKRSRQPARGS